jgi:hypothetical protein
VHGLWAPERGCDCIMFDLIDPVAMMFLLIAVLGLIMAVAYGRM